MADIEDIRARAAKFARKHEGNSRWVDEELAPLLDRLRARLAEVEAERDRARENSLRRLEANIDLRARAEAAEARLAEVEALCDLSPLYLATADVRAAARGEADRG